MIYALDVDETRPYSLVCDTSEPKTLFILGIIDGVLLSAIEDSQTQFAVSNGSGSAAPDISVNLHGKNVQIVKFGLRGWENLKDKKGNDVQFKSQTLYVPKVGTRASVHDDSMKRLSKEVISELAAEILKASEFTKAEEKN
ncbi:MAG: hypothetical protein EPO24_09405 [Bacteroidetes bacterium]|nr:MAG: hypothetical protein EPO24_09405 [Bacteroidota bacterium]